MAQIFQEIGDILELKGENRFRVSSYHRAAQTLANMSTDVRQIMDQDPKKLQDIPGIGEALSSNIEEILNTGRCAAHERLLASFDQGLLELLTVRGLGPKKVKKFYDELGIDSVKKLEVAAKKGVLAELEGMGEKSQDEILKAIKEHAQHRERTMLHTAMIMAEALVAYMKDCPAVKKVEFAGSLRRGRETVGDIDVLATGENHEQIISHFVSHPDVEKILAQGETKASVLLENVIQADLRVVDADSFGAALYYFTGSKQHNIATRKVAISKGLKINEYGIFKGKKSMAGKTEADIFKVLGLPYIIPELREDQGEVMAGYDKKLPKSVKLEDIRGDFHLHTDASDGHNSLEEVVTKAKSLGYEYMCVTDHSSALRVAHGLDEKRLNKQIKEIDALNKKLRDFRILKGAEVDIMKDGTLDYPDSILKRLDMVGIAIHSHLSLPADEQTARIVKALSNPYVAFLAHPTGKIVKSRDPYDVDLVQVLRAAKKNDVAMEINANTRLDLNGANCRLAKEHGAKFMIGTDAHQLFHMDFMRFGVITARRGWLEKKDVLNTWSLSRLLKWLDKKG